MNNNILVYSNILTGITSRGADEASGKLYIVNDNEVYEYNEADLKEWKFLSWQTLPNHRYAF